MSDDRPESLAAQAAAWVPPWERQQQPPDRAYQARVADAQRAADDEDRSGAGRPDDGDRSGGGWSDDEDRSGVGRSDDDDGFDESSEGSDPPGYPDSVPPELPPIPGEAEGPISVDAPLELDDEPERAPTDVGPGPELPLPDSIEQAADDAGDDTDGSPVDAPFPAEGDDAGDVFDAAADDEVGDDEVDLPVTEVVPGPDPDSDPDSDPDEEAADTAYVTGAADFEEAFRAGVTGSGPVGPDSAGTGPVGSDLADPDPDPTDSDPIDTGPAGLDPIDSGPTGPDTTDSGPVGLDPIDFGSAGPDPAGSGLAGLDLADSGSAGFDLAGSGPVGDGPISSGAPGFDPAGSGPVGLDPTSSGPIGFDLAGSGPIGGAVADQDVEAGPPTESGDSSVAATGRVPAQARGKRRPAGAVEDAPTRTEEDSDSPQLDDAEMAAALEAIMLVVDEPVGEMQLAQILRQPAERVATVLEDLSARYTAAGHGFDLRRAAGGWRLYTRPEYASYVERFVLDGQSVRLTQAALETLAVVAYKQPVTRSRISAIRGVNCDGVMRTLVTRGLIEECGTEGETGAYLYRTTVLFLEKLGLNSVDQLPPLAPFLPDDVEEVLDASG